ncbi:MAG: (Fe-S)-binding protein, partial [Deltaproteobacteria bacterium]|nr:(Fe-S)-binding protein [Deltaproteobacteria bacterium]
ACSRCGRCQEVCPAALAGEDFDPRSFLRCRLAGASLETIWNCSTCRACEEVCPLLICPPQLVVQDRARVIEDGVNVPAEAMEALESLAKHSNPWGSPRRKRAAWTKGLEVRTWARSQEPAEILYFVGCTTSVETRAQGMAKALAALFQAVQVDFAILGDKEPCCGDAARQWGEVGLYEMLWEETSGMLAQVPAKEVVCTSPHCLYTFVQVYPLTAAALKEEPLGLDFLHYSLFLERLLDQGRLKPGPVDLERVTFHDPCYLGRWLGHFEPPRRVIRSIPGLELVEMARRGPKSFCCGGGGGRAWQDFQGPAKPAVLRLKEAAATGAEALVTACPLCLIMFEDGLKTSGLEGQLKVIDLAELVARSIGG